MALDQCADATPGVVLSKSGRGSTDRSERRVSWEGRKGSHFADHDNNHGCIRPGRCICAERAAGLPNATVSIFDRQAPTAEDTMVLMDYKLSGDTLTTVEVLDRNIEKADG